MDIEEWVLYSITPIGDYTLEKHTKNGKIRCILLGDSRKTSLVLTMESETKTKKELDKITTDVFKRIVDILENCKKEDEDEN